MFKLVTNWNHPELDLAAVIAKPDELPERQRNQWGKHITTISTWVEKRSQWQHRTKSRKKNSVRTTMEKAIWQKTKWFAQLEGDKATLQIELIWEMEKNRRKSQLCSKAQRSLRAFYAKHCSLSKKNNFVELFENPAKAIEEHLEIIDKKFKEYELLNSPL